MYAGDLKMLLLVSIIGVFVMGAESLKKEDCEVCFTVLERFTATLTDDVKSDLTKIEDEFKKFCKTTSNSNNSAKVKENKFCYYLGGLEESATSILRDLSKPISYSLPVDKLCERLMQKVGGICALRYEFDTHNSMNLSPSSTLISSSIMSLNIITKNKEHERRQSDGFSPFCQKLGFDAIRQQDVPNGESGDDGADPFDYSKNQH
ncbi:unnamed protein product [Nesidiocoris tenuis]|uniref:ARMET N-terminal domain-containing protein n=1 Tax=Nesidiocoris tenuis TaxID=355587 RepID=A0A6H5HH52_9HEMI|nr:unnamed protein product [Nesidiocoris tenuis]